LSLLNVQPQESGITGWVLSLMQTLGEPGAGLAVALENLFPPVPSEVILPLAGFSASKGDISLPGAVIWTTIGSLVGALVLYGAGALLGRRRVLALAGKVPLIQVSDVEKSEDWFKRHGGKAVFFGRMVPVFRSFISIPAGVERMPIWMFALYTTLGSLIWNTAFILAGYVLGENWTVVERYSGVFTMVVIAALVVWAAWFVITRLRAARDRRAAEPERDQA
jgi:membrane protein DedA with SNARE-associated domain